MRRRAPPPNTYYFLPFVRVLVRVLVRFLVFFLCSLVRAGSSSVNVTFHLRCDGLMGSIWQRSRVMRALEQGVTADCTQGRRIPSFR